MVRKKISGKAPADKADEEAPAAAEKAEKKPARASRATDSSVIYKTGEMPKLRGGGIAMRLAFVISGAIFLIMVVVAIVMMIVVSNAVDRQIDEDGVVMARLLASSDVDSWRAKLGVDESIQPRDEAEARVKFNQSRFSSLLADESQLLNARITAIDKGSPVTRRDAQGDRLTGDKKEAPEFREKAGSGYKVGDVDVIYGFMTVGNRYYDCRSYQAPMKDYNGEIVGYATVVLSEDQISKQKWSLAGTIAILFVIFIGLGIGVSFLVGRKITKPIKDLIEDVSIVAGGDLTHHTVPKSGDEIGLLARTFDKMTKNLQEAQSKEMELAAQRHQMAIAHEVQENLLPDKIPEVQGYEIMAYHRSSRDMHGSYYDVIRYPDGQVGVLVAAASGKGIPAAMVMTMARSYFRALGEKASDPASMMRETNRLLSPDLRAGMYVEVLMVLFDPNKHKAKMVSAGPSSLFRFNAADQKLQGISGDGIALGFDKGPVFDKSLKEIEFDVAVGDRLVLNTPGLFSIKSFDGVELGVRGFAKAINKHAVRDSQTFVDRVVTILDNYAGAEVKDTDITFLTVKRVS